MPRRTPLQGGGPPNYNPIITILGLVMGLSALSLINLYTTLYMSYSCPEPPNTP